MTVRESEMKIGQIHQCYICGRKIFVEIIPNIGQKRGDIPRLNITCWDCMPKTGQEIATKIFKLNRSEIKD